ncbi:MAG: regulator of protease activity HflC (stomatin/prohibitin superfamily) [Myxococcota bacterium]|jgi:regulator of protease activity HflC (stomatin/prohibitin superfamily)
MLTNPDFWIAFGIGAAMLLVLVPICRLVFWTVGIYTIVDEREAQVFVLFGKVLGVIDDPGLHSPFFKFGLRGLMVRTLGQVHTVDLRLDQVYKRSQPVNSEEGTPMGVGVWYEMLVSNPVDFIFKNTDPRGSLEANVANAAVRCLSNMGLDELLVERHGMSERVREEVSPTSEEWGYRLGSVYIRKVHFRDQEMIHQIEQKVVNRLRQVTSAIFQAGTNQVDVIKSRAEKEAAGEFARAQAMRPQVVGEALGRLSKSPQILKAVLDVLEVRRIVDGEAIVTLIPKGGSLLPKLLAARSSD